MIPMSYYANVKLPYIGWTGETFDSPEAARKWIARMLRTARINGRKHWVMRPSTRTSYYVRPQLLLADD
ncbi:hypothetical protein [Bradyrhizobium sp. 2S1]|uniref:hypothetical protein n=1 Tax=Bradyrhizobium sp. 2S1 TaxID=1404429 RepID=UPI00140CB12E|nr:hypothetical protein [Bradyrhizobium sp. 2S1]MCK7669164.1 hypothetical protein [Bradyrhizobium sp. 2S1]